MELLKFVVSQIGLLIGIGVFAVGVSYGTLFAENVAKPSTKALVAQVASSIQSVSAKARITSEVDCEVGAQTHVFFDIIPATGAGIQIEDQGNQRWFDAEGSREGEGLDGFFANGTYKGVIIPRVGYGLDGSSFLEFTVSSTCPGDISSIPPSHQIISSINSTSSGGVKSEITSVEPKTVVLRQEISTNKDLGELVKVGGEPSREVINFGSSWEEGATEEEESECGTEEECESLCGKSPQDKIACMKYVQEEVITDFYTSDDENIVASSSVLALYFKMRNGSRTYIDTDNDGITDFDERNIYRTDPNDDDTDNDGKKDDEEIMEHTDPTRKNDSSTSSEEHSDEFAPESPLTNTSSSSELLGVANVQVLSTTTDEKGVGHIAELEFRGHAPANTFVTLYIYSEPFVVTVKADKSGSWTYTLTKELPDGSHQIYSAITDGGGKILAKSEPLPFVKQAAAANVGSALLLPQTQGAPSFFAGSPFSTLALLILGILTAAIGMIGLISRRKPPQPIA